MRAVAAAQIRASSVSVELGGALVLDDVSLTVAPGDRIGLVGPNGVGKSTLLRVLAGRLAPTRGSVAVVPAGAPVGLMSQELEVAPGQTVLDNVAARVGVAAASGDLDRATEALAAGTGEAIEAHQAALERWLRLGGDDLERRLAAAVVETGLAPDGRALDWPAARLSGGQQARVGLAALLVSRFEVLLLDEPTNNLDGAGLDLLERFVTTSDRATVVVSHDRRFLEAVVTTVVELDEHRRSATVHHYDWSGYLRARDVARAEAQRRYDEYSGENRRLLDRAQRQREWATKGLRSERNPPDNDRAARGARIDRTEQLASKARQAQRAIERLETVDKPWQPWELQFSIGSAERSGDLVAELIDAVVDRDRFRLGPLTLTVGAGERIVIGGANGAGKTTLIGALLGEVDLAAGSRRTGPSVVPGRLGQERRHDADAGPFLQRFQDETGLDRAEARSLLAKFGLTGEHLDRPSHRWSPGERTRAALAGFQARQVNTLILDEPTNHLDLPAIEQLEQALDHFAGTVIVVSHDRAFLDGVTLTRRIELADGGVVLDEPL